MSIELDERLVHTRDALRAHIASNRPQQPRLPGTRSPEARDLAEYKAWCASLFAAGFVGYEWPSEWGGTGRSDPLMDFVVDRELADAGVPRPIGAYNLVAQALLASGTGPQKEFYLARIRSFTDLWCQLFSEPEAGSDLAALRTRAVRDGDDWVVDGQKVWTTHGHVADFGLLLARTDATVSKHAGISAFIVDMTSPGVDVRPLRELTGSSDFNEVFFSGVRVPAANLIGEPGQGWKIARAALAHERALSLREDSVVDSAAKLLALAKEVETSSGNRVVDDLDVKRRIGELTARARVTDLLGIQSVLREADGTSGAIDAAVIKVMFSETNLEIATCGVDIQGSDGILTDSRSSKRDHWQEAFLWARGYTISAGSNEIMLNLIAEIGLGLPREVRPVEKEA
jgi:alkylation response protein AidB-like acyl-CoA dehydrogenase